MTTLIQFKKGDILFRRGDVSYNVLRVRSGEIEVLREVGATSVVIGHARDGEWLGEMGVIEGRSRSATAHAVTDGECEVLTAYQFLERVSSDPALAHDLLLRLSVRLRNVEDKIAGDLLPFAHERSSDGAGETASDAVIADATIWLTAQGDALCARIGAAPIHVATLHFMVGRIPVEGDAQPSRRPEGRRTARSRRKSRCSGRQGFTLQILGIHQLVGAIHKSLLHPHLRAGGPPHQQ